MNSLHIRFLPNRFFKKIIGYRNACYKEWNNWVMIKNAQNVDIVNVDVKVKSVMIVDIKNVNVHLNINKR